MALTAPSAYWDTDAAGASGTQLDATVGQWVRQFIIKDIGTIKWDHHHAVQRQTRCGAVDTAMSVPLPVERKFVIRCSNANETPGSQAMLNAQISEWRRLQTLLSPDAGEVYMKITRTDDDDSTPVANMLLARVTELPAMPFPDPGKEAVYAGFFDYPLHVLCVYPWLWNLTADTQATTEIGVTPGTATCTNGGVGYCPVKFVVDDISGTVTKMTISNTTTGQQISVSSAAFVDDDTIDLGYTDKHWNTDPLSGTGAPAFAADGSSNARADPMLLAPGSNSISVARDTGTGTCTLDIYWQEVYGSL